MTQKKSAWQSGSEQPVFIPPWLAKLDRPQRADLYQQYRAAVDSKKMKALAALTAVGLGGYGAAYIHKKNKMTQELAPERHPDNGEIPVNSEDMGIAEKTSEIVIDRKPTRSIAGDVSELAGSALSKATGSGVRNGMLSNPSLIWGLGVGLPTLGVGTMAYKGLIDKLYKPPTEGQKELEEAAREFNALLSQDQGGIKASGLTKTNSFIEAFEDRDAFTKRSNVYASWLPAIAAISALGAGYGTANYLGKTDPDVIKKKAAEEAMKRLRASQPPRLQAVAVDDPAQYTEMANLDNVDRNVIPVLKKKLAGKNAKSQDYFSKMSADMSPQQLAGAIQQMSQKNPEAINGLIDYMKQTNPDALKALGGADLDNNKLSGNLVNILNGSGPMGGMKAHYAANQILQNMDKLPPEYSQALRSLTSSEPGSQNQPQSMSSQIQPWQAGAAAASAGLGVATGHPLMGAAGAGAALYGPQMWEKYKNAQPTSDPAQATAWMKGNNGHANVPYMLPNKALASRPVSSTGNVISTARNAVSTVGRGIKNTVTDVKRGIGNLAWRIKEPVHQTIQDTFFRPPTDQKRTSALYDVGHLKDL